jgi:hypothetical protein
MTRKQAYKLLDKAVSLATFGGLGLSDLPDTPTVMNALDEMEECDEEEAVDIAQYAAEEILEENDPPLTS